MNISIITFTENGTKLAEKIRQAFVSAKTEEAKNLGLSLSDWTRQQFAEKNAIVVIGACGIAVRMIAPFVSDKLSDSPAFFHPVFWLKLLRSPPGYKWKDHIFLQTNPQKKYDSHRLPL